MSGKNPNSGDTKKGSTESPRKHPRYIVPWEVAIVETGCVHSAVVADISISGVSLFSERNLQTSSNVALTIKIPMYRKGQEVIVGVECSVLYSMLSSDSYGKFRVGYKFLNFRKNGRQELQTAFSNRIAIGGHTSIYGV